MTRFRFFLPIVLALSVKAESTNAVFQSAVEQTALLELYTSEGCSSCPPAETWLSRLKDSAGLWKEFVPVAFHVDYWDHLGWKDPLADPEYSDRQRDYAQLWKAENIYTPEFVLGGKEWRSWLAERTVPKSPGAKAGILKVNSLEPNRWEAVFQPVSAKGERYKIHAALLSCGLSSDVRAGENRGRLLQHDFAATALITVPMKPGNEIFSAHFVLLPRPELAGRNQAVAVWVTEGENLEPMQATGGWLVPPSPMK